MKAFFDCPTQVMFRCEGDDKDGFNFGIGYHDVIICGCCGGVSEIEEVEELYEMPWCDIHEAIRGDVGYEDIKNGEFD